MRIAIVIESFDPDAGGNERSTAQIAAQLRDRGHAVTIVTGSACQADIPGVTIHAMRPGKSSSVFRLLAFARWARQQIDGGAFDVSLSVTMAVAADVVQPRGGTVRETLARNVAMRNSPGSRLLKKLATLVDPKQRLLLALERRTLADPRVKRIVAVSRYVTRQVGVHYNVEESRVELIPNASVMPAADAAQRAAWRKAVRDGFAVPEGSVVFLFAAQNPRLKGFGTLMHATRLLIDQGHKPVVLLAGEYGYSHQDWIAELGIRHAVRIVGQTRQMPRLFAAADVTVLPSYYDPSSKVVIESLMMGVPAISTAFNGASDFIDVSEGVQRGRVIADPGSASELAEAMASLCDAGKRAACVAAIGEGLASELSMSRHVDRLERVLHDAVSPVSAPD